MQNNNIVEVKQQETSLQLTNEMQMVLPFAESYNQIFSGKVDANEAKHLMIVFAQKLGNTFDKSGNPAIKVCSQDSIRQVAYEILNKRLDLSKSQTSLITYGTKLTLQDEYFGKIALCKRELGISIRGTIIHEGDVVDISIDSRGLRTITHKTSWNNYSNKITGAWAAAYNEKGELVETDIMTYNEIYTSWLQSKGGIKDTHKKFTNEMARKTVEGRLAKHIYNKSDSKSGLYDAYDDNDEYEETETPEYTTYSSNNDVVEVDFSNEPIVEPVVINENVVQQESVVEVQEPVVEVVSEQFVEPIVEPVVEQQPIQQFQEPVQQQSYQPNQGVKDFTGYTYQDIEQLNLAIGTEIKVKYGTYKDAKLSQTQKWNSVPNTYNQSDYTTNIKRIK